jgi:hypothetical protein
MNIRWPVVVVCCTLPLAGSLAVACSGTPPGGTPDAGAADSGSVVDGAIDAPAVADSGIGDTGSPDTATADAGVDAAPLRCSQTGLASGTVTDLTPAPMSVTTYSVNDACGGVHVSVADGSVYRCGYAGCNPAALGGLPQITFAASRSGVVTPGANVYLASAPNNQSEGIVTQTNLLLSAAPTTVFTSTQASILFTPMRKWGTGAVVTWQGLGNNRSTNLTYLADGASMPMVGTFNGIVGFAPKDASSGYVFSLGATSTGPKASLTKLAYAAGALTSTQGIAPVGIVGPFPLSAWLSSTKAIFATNDALFLLRRADALSAPTLSKCAHTDITPCATEVALPAIVMTDIADSFYVAHDRVYALRANAALLDLVYCTTASVATNTCNWTVFKPGVAAVSVAGIPTPDMQWDHDADNLYILNRTSGRATVERIAK